MELIVRTFRLSKQFYCFKSLLGGAVPLPHSCDGETLSFHLGDGKTFRKEIQIDNFNSKGLYKTTTEEGKDYHGIIFLTNSTLNVYIGFYNFLEVDEKGSVKKFLKTLERIKDLAEEGGYIPKEIMIPKDFIKEMSVCKAKKRERMRFREIKDAGGYYEPYFLKKQEQT